jgi:hypothetical protein
MRQYYSNAIEVTWQDLDFKEGLAQGSFITPARNAPSFSQKPQLNGKYIRSFNADKGGTVTVLVNQSSDLHQKLLEIALEDRVPSGKKVGPMVIKDIASGRQTTFQNAYIQSETDEAFALEDSDLSWVFGFEKVEYTNPQDNANLVGN